MEGVYGMDIVLQIVLVKVSVPKYHWACQWLMGIGRICYFYSQHYTGWQNAK